MTPLRKRMMEELRVRNLSEITSRLYIGAAERFAKYYRRSPDQLGPEQIREFFLNLLDDEKVTASTLQLYRSALRFLYTKTLRRPWFEGDFAKIKQRVRLPTVLSAEEITRILDRITNLKHWTMIATLHATGLRVSELRRLKVSDIDSQTHVDPCAAGQGTNSTRHRFIPGASGAAAHLLATKQAEGALTRGDALLDDELPNDLRESLFAIRDQLAGATAILDAENGVRRAVESASGKVLAVDALNAWVNGDALETEAPVQDSRALPALRRRSDAGTYLIRSLQREALAAMPPHLPMPEAVLPALKKDFIVRIRWLGGSAEGTVRLRQEVWRIKASVQGIRQVKRTIVVVEIHSKSGGQIPTSREAKYYQMDAGDTLEEIYDANAAQ